MCLQVSTGGGAHTSKWFTSIPKGEIVVIMTNVLSSMTTYLMNCLLMENYLINMST